MDDVEVVVRALVEGLGGQDVQEAFKGQTFY